MSVGNDSRTDLTREWLGKALGLPDGSSPFPWQEDLLSRLIDGQTVRALDIPTGLGKTAVMPIWLIASTRNAKLPRRLVYVVDRRAVVDQATTEAERLRTWVASNPRMKEVLGLERPLPISTLRGKFIDNREWLEDPASRAIIVGTVDMVGSRLLFEGYGVSRKMRPYHAGLLGADALVVLDEAHLVPPFEKLLHSIADGVATYGPRDEKLRDLVPRFQLLSLSATGRTVEGVSLSLTARDLEHPVVNRRLNATKRVSLKTLNAESSDGAAEDAAGESENRPQRLAEALANEAWKLSESGKRSVRILVYSDSRKAAEAAKRAIEKLAKGARTEAEHVVPVDAELFVGGRRVLEREQAANRLTELGFLAGTDRGRSRPAFLFATSAAEVGVDLDADHMVCDLVAWERMVQRLGRVNRRGNGKASVIVLIEPQPEPKKKEREAIEMKAKDQELDERETKLVVAYEARVRQWRSYQAPFKHLPTEEGGSDASPRALRDVKERAAKDESLNMALDHAMTPPPLRPALTRALVDAWSMTSLEIHTGRPEIDPWLRGWMEDDLPQTAVVWRTYLPVRAGARQPTRKEVEAFFEAAPPHASEILETESFRVLEWIEKRANAVRQRAQKRASDSADVPLPRPNDVVAIVLSRAGGLRCVLRLNDLADGENSNDLTKNIQSPLGGSTLIVDARLAGLEDGLLSETEDSSPRTADDGQEWLGKHIIGFRIRSTEADERVTKDPEWRERLRFASELSEEGETRRWLVIDKWRHDAATEEDRSSSRPQLLDEHHAWTEEQVRKLARRLGLDKGFENMLAVAARLHDQGKRTQRWQRAFHASGSGVYAKTRGPIDYALLDGYRHEFGSLPYAEKDAGLKELPAELRELALHLIAAHHGFARPVIGTRGCEDAPPSALKQRAQGVALRFVRLQQRWGPWALAWWEALLRAADWQASRDNDAQDIPTMVDEQAEIA